MDSIPPPPTLLEKSSYVPEQQPIKMSRYISQEFHEQEVEKMWSRVWQYACWTGDIPNPGDVSVYRNVGQSVIVVRQNDGSIKAFRNSCLHRGRELCTEKTNQAQLRCPYHGWTWGLEGKMRWIPAQWDFKHVEKDKFSLPEVRCEIWNGFVFINMDPDAPSLEQYLGKMVGQWKDKEWDFSNRYRAVTVERQLNCNWKTAMDAFIETYHVYATHPEAAALTPDTATQYDVWDDEPHFSRFHSITGLPSANLAQQPNQQEVLDSFVAGYLPEVFGTPEGELRDGETAREALRRLAKQVYQDRMGINSDAVPNSQLIDGTEYMVFPNFLVWPSDSNPLVYRFLPGPTPDSCIWETSLFIRFEGERPQPGAIYKLGLGEPLSQIKEMGFMGPLLTQDCENLEYMQAGMKASGTGVIQSASYQEQRLRHYHQIIDRYLAK